MQHTSTQANRRNGVLKWAASVLVLTISLPYGLTLPASADTLDRIRTAGTLTLGYREDARPFSYKDDAGQPAGFSVTLCQKIAEEIKTELDLPGLTLQWTPVTAADRHPALQQGRIDLLCGADSVSLSGRKDVSFSLPVYPNGIGAFMRADGSQALRDVLEGNPPTGPIWRGSPAHILNQKTYAVVAGTTAETWVAERIQHFQLDVVTVPVESYTAGVAALTDGTADVLFGDHAIIVETAGAKLTDGSLVALERQFTSAPLALTLARDNDSLRLIVDRTLSRLYAAPEFRDLFVKSFGAPSVGNLLFYEMTALPQQ